MKHILATDSGVVEEAAQVLKEGGVIVFPTDTAYGLGVDALNKDAVAKLFNLKGRDENKPIHIIVADRNMAMRYVVTTEMGERLMETFLPGPLSLVFEKRDRIPSELVGGTNTVGIRIPNTPLAQEIARVANTAYTATSANKSGDLAPYTIEAVLESFGDKAKDIDLIIDAGELSQQPVSTLVDVRDDEPVILREGPISREDIARVVG